MAGPPWWSRVSCWWWTSSCSWGPAGRGRRVDRDLLADGRLESGVEREQERLDVLPVGRVEILEHGSRDEVEHGGHAAVVQEPEAPHLIADGGAAGDAGHADLLVEVAEVSDLELLRLA